MELCPSQYLLGRVVSLSQPQGRAMSLSDPYTGPQAPPSVGPCSLQTPTTNLRPSVPSGWGHISLETSRVGSVSLRAPKGRATSPSNPQGKAMPTYLRARSQAHNLASHFD